MKKNAIPYLRLAGTAVLIAIIAGLLVSGFGWLIGWRTAVQFSNGLSGAGSIILALGILSLAGGYRMRGGLRVPNRRTDSDLNRSDRAKLWAADTVQGYNPLVLFAITGLCLIGMAILVGNTTR
jgi:hypothetical protein